jgi:hypothetical protein
MKYLLLLLFCASTFAAPRQDFLEASDQIYVSFFEFNDDPTVQTPPDEGYVWIPSGLTHSVDGIFYTGPGWVVTGFDSEWIVIRREFVPGYRVQVNTSLRFAVAGIRAVGAQYGVTYYNCADAVQAWKNLGGSSSGICPKVKGGQFAK